VGTKKCSVTGRNETAYWCCLWLSYLLGERETAEVKKLSNFSREYLRGKTRRSGKSKEKRMSLDVENDVPGACHMLSQGYLQERDHSGKNLCTTEGTPSTPLHH